MHYTTSCNTQSSAPEDGRDQRPKHVELTGIINKPLLLHLFGVYIIYKCTCIGLHVKYPVFLPDFNEIQILSTDFRKIISNINLHAVRTELVHEDGQTDGYGEANGRFSQFCESPREKHKKILRRNQMQEHKIVYFLRQVQNFS